MTVPRNLPRTLNLCYYAATPIPPPSKRPDARPRQSNARVSQGPSDIQYPGPPVRLLGANKRHHGHHGPVRAQLARRAAAVEAERAHPAADGRGVPLLGPDGDDLAEASILTVAAALALAVQAVDLRVLLRGLVLVHGAPHKVLVVLIRADGDGEGEEGLLGADFPVCPAVDTR